MGTNADKGDKPTGKQRGNIANLRPWKPGQSGNPKGRPKGMTLTSILRKVFEEDPAAAEAFVRNTITQALSGEAPYAKEVWERMDGKVRTDVRLDSDVNIAVKRTVAFGDEANLDADDHA